MDKTKIMETNKDYWNQHADLWFGTTALPTDKTKKSANVTAIFCHKSKKTLN